MAGEVVYVQLTLVMLKDNQDFDQRMNNGGKNEALARSDCPPEERPHLLRCCSVRPPLSMPAEQTQAPRPVAKSRNATSKGFAAG